MDKTVKELLRTWENTSLTGYGSPGAPERRAGLWIGKAGARFFPDGFVCEPSGRRAEWGVLLSGRLIIRCRGETYPVQGGESYCLPPRCEAVAAADETPYIVWFEVCGDSAADFAQLCGFPAERPGVRRARYTEVKTALDIALCLHRRPDRFGYVAFARLWEFVANASEGGDEVLPSPVSEEIRRVIRAVHRNDAGRTYTLSELACLAGLPVETFRKRFLAEMGVPPARYILERKLERAKEMLETGDALVCDVAERLGFLDPYYFSRLFKRHVGVSPKHYAQGMKKTYREDQTAVREP